MTISTDVTIYRRPEDLNSLINEPSDGAFIHGLFMQGARWMTVEEASAANQTRLTSGVKCAGVIVDSHAKDLLPPMPVLYVKAVSVEAEWEPTSIGYLRPNMYNCPCYYTSFRGPTYVFLATLDTEEPATMHQCRCSFVVELRRSPLEFLVNYRSSIFLGSKLDITIVLFFQVVWRRGTKTARQDAPDPRLRSQVCLFTVCSPTGNHDTKCSALTVTSRCLRPRARLGVGTGSAGRLRVGHIPRRVV